MKRAGFVLLMMVLSATLGIGTYGIVQISYDNKEAKKASKTSSTVQVASTTTSTTSPVKETSTTSTTLLFNRGESTTTTTVPEKESLDSTTTTALPNKEMSDDTADCESIELLDYWRNANVEDIPAFIARIPETRRWIVTCGDAHPIQALEMRDWMRIRLSI